MPGSRALQTNQPKCYRRDSFCAYISARTDQHDEKNHLELPHKQHVLGPTEVQRRQLLSEVRGRGQRVQQ